MSPHPYLRAYLAGIGVPTAFLLVVLTAFLWAHQGGWIAGIERLIVFPMAVVPNVWGFWNVLYVALSRRSSWPIGLHGAALPFVLLPAGMLLASTLQVELYTPSRVAAMLPVGVILYYLAWKHLVAFLNRLLGVNGQAGRDR
jgi:hypothetical protein